MLPIKLSFCMMQLLFFKVPYQPMWKICRPLYTPVMILIQMIVPFAVLLWFKNHTALLSMLSIPIRFSGMGNCDATKKL